MTRTRIKICGVCRVEDALAAARLGADAIGLVRVTGAGRFVDLALAKQIAAALPAFVTPVLLYQDADVHNIRDDLAALGRSAVVQLHGQESPSDVAALAGVTVIKAVRMNDRASETISALVRARLSNLAGLVLESPGSTGGTGQPNDWPLVRSLQSAGVFGDLPLIAAGGLTPSTVANVVRQIRPAAVDVSSGVEDRRREKSPAKLQAFVAAVRSADELLQA